jgi:phosphoribosylamine---glycine ligase
MSNGSVTSIVTEIFVIAPRAGIFSQVDTIGHRLYRFESVEYKGKWMKVLVIGGGGREHALVWKLKQSPHVEKIWCAPGNGGIQAEAECLPADPADVQALVALAARLHPDLTVVGPELPLVNGIGDAFRSRGWPIVAPSQQAAQLEGSKIFAKEFLRRHNIPTAQTYGVYDTAQSAVNELSGLNWPVVIKADGLCAGKGVFVAQDAASAEDFIRRVLDQNELGPGGKRILLEETLEGEELSFIIVTDGQRYAPLVPTRDHKRVFDGNRGPNTGGMGAYSTDDLLPNTLRQRILESIVEPTMRGLAAEGILYQGFLYFGLMLTTSGPKVLEFNCRLGDPETQAIVARMDFDLAQVLTEVAAETLEPSILKWKPGASVCVVIASGGYPGKFAVGRIIGGLTDAESINGVKVFHAGTRREGSAIATSGGRVLGVTAIGATIDAALSSAYEATAKVRFDGIHYRKDIAAPAGRVHAAGD